jgi:hypothetical protein
LEYAEELLMADTPDITLQWNGQNYGLFLVDDVRSIQESSAEESTFNARFSRGKKKYGEDPILMLAEWRDWVGGRGGQNFEDDATSYYDGLAWTVHSGTVVPTPRWQIAQGTRSENRYMPGDISWKPLLGLVTNGQRYLTVPFNASSGYVASHIWLYIRRLGTPGTCTVSLYSDSGGQPGTALQTVTKTTADITDYIDVFFDFPPASPPTLTSATVYWLVVSGDQNDNADNCWMVGVDRATPGCYSSPTASPGSWTPMGFKLYYRVTDAHISKRFIFQTYNGNVYATTRPPSGTSSFYVFDNVNTFSAAGSTTGLAIVSGRPCLSGLYMYFPQGESTNIRRWDLATTWADEGTAKATYLNTYYDSTAGPQMVKVNTSTVALGSVPASPITWGSAITCGDGTYPITNTLVHLNKLYVFKSDQIGTLTSGLYGLLESNFKNSPSARNGAAVCSWNGLLYFSWLNTIMESYAGTANDVGQAWRGGGPTGNRASCVSSILGIDAWRICGMDAGASGYSSIQIFNGTTWHEIYRAPYGHRIRDIWWQYVDGGHSRLFIDIDYDVVYLEFPVDVANPTNDPTHNYSNSFYITSSTFDDGAARLPKYLKSVTLSTTNCGKTKDTYVWFEVDYQTDNDVGIDGASHWHHAGNVFTSPEGSLRLNLGDKRCIRIRIRGYTDTSTVPPQLDAVTLDGFTRTPARTIWTLKCKVAPTGSYKKKASDFLKFLQEASATADDITVTSAIPELNGKHVIITRPRTARENLNKVTLAWDGTVIFSIMDMTDT